MLLVLLFNRFQHLVVPALFGSQLPVYSVLKQFERCLVETLLCCTAFLSTRNFCLRDQHKYAMFSRQLEHNRSLKLKALRRQLNNSGMHIRT